MIISIVGTRPNLVKLAPIVRVTKRKKIRHQIIHTGQHYDYELSQIFFEELRIPEPELFLGVGSGSDSKQIGNTILKVSYALRKIKHDFIVLVYGDTNATVGGAIGAKKEENIVAHIEAGVRAGDLRLPEEINRMITESCSDILFAPTELTYNNLSHTSRAILSGDVMKDNLLWANDLLTNDILQEVNVESKEYMLLTMHRGLNVDSKKTLRRIISTLSETGETIVFPVHPRTQKTLEKINLPSCIRVISPQGYLKFLSLIKNSKKVITDSGGVQKEAYAFGIPCVTLLEAHLWPEIVETGWNFSAGQDPKKIIHGIQEFWPRNKRPAIFGNGQASEKIIETLVENYNSIVEA